MQGFDGIKLRIFAFFTLSMLFLVPMISAFLVLFRFKYFLRDGIGSARALYISIIILCFVRFICFGFVTDILYDKLWKEEFNWDKKHGINVDKSNNELFGNFQNESSLFQINDLFDNYAKNKTTSLNSTPKSIVLLVMSPDFVFVVSYLTLTWHLYTVQSLAYQAKNEYEPKFGDGKCILFIVMGICFVL